MPRSLYGAELKLYCSLKNNQVRNFLLFSLGMFYTGMGGETFAHTPHGYALVAVGLVIIVKIMLQMVKVKDSYAPLYVLQFWIVILGLGSLFDNVAAALTIKGIAAVGGLYVALRIGLEADKKEKEKIKNRNHD